jgi:hypothetical protein
MEGHRMSATAVTDNHNQYRNTLTFRVFLRIYGIFTLSIFVSLLIGFFAQSPLLAEHGGALNWTIWNDVRCGSEHLHVPPMLMVIYIVWGVFLLRAARDPAGYSSFLNFTMWANLAHGVLMAGQAATEVDRYWSKFFTDIPFVLILAVGIYLWRRAAKPRPPRAAVDARSAQPPR